MAQGQAFALPEGQRFALTRGKGKRADYILYYKPNIPIAIVEAQDDLHPMGAGMQQGLEYSATRSRPCEGQFVPALAARRLPSGDEAISQPAPAWSLPSLGLSLYPQGHGAKQ